MVSNGLNVGCYNYFVVAKNLKDSIKKARQNSAFKKNKMHIDGIQELNAVDGYQIKLVKDNLINDMVIYNYDAIKKIN